MKNVNTSTTLCQAFQAGAQWRCEEDLREMLDTEFSFILDGLFWSFHPQTLYVEAYPSRKLDSIKVS